MLNIKFNIKGESKEMKLKNCITTVMATAVVVGALTACGTSGAKAEATTEASAEASETTAAVTEAEETEAGVSETEIEPCEVTFWHSMTGAQETSLTELTDQFNNENEYGIHVTLVNQGGYGDLSTKLTANAAADTLPDLSQAYNNWIVPYLDKVVHLDEFVENDYEDYEDILQNYRDENSQFGFISGMPFNKSTYVYFYNKTLFDELGLEAPKTWDDMLEIGKAFKEEKDMISFGADDMTDFLQTSLRQNGVAFVTEEGPQFENEAGQETFDYIMEMYNNGYARLAGEDGYFSGPISNQLVASYIGSSTGVSYINHDGWELGVAPLPQNKEKAATTAGTNIIMFSKDENQQKAAWEYIKFMTTSEATTKFAIETGYLPIRTSAFESAEYHDFMKTDATATAAYEQSDAYFTAPVFDGSAEIQSEVNATLEEVILEQADGQTAMQKVADTIKDIL